MSVARVLARLRRRPAAASHRFDPHTPLARLKLLAIDCETTGLDARRDRIVSIAAIRIAEGLHVVETPVFDLLIDPDAPIPATATAIHGIDAAALRGAPSFARVFDRIAAAIEDAVVVGHHVGFDLAMLAREAARAHLPWREPPSLDTAAMLGGVIHATPHLDLLDALARLGVHSASRRHTAAGDAHMAAELFVALARRLAYRGRGSFADAVAAQRAHRR
jgi:DNA polymerase III epsilon subunit-like protein